MAPIEDLHSRDLAWISEFVMQQMVIMMRPLLDHLQNTDVTVEYVQQVVQRLSMDVTDVREDIERTNKCVGILRQGLGVHNESKCMLQRGIDSSARIVKRLDDQMDNMFGVIRGMEDSVSQNCADVRGVGAKHEELARLMAEGTSNMEDLQAKVERICNDAHSMKDDVMNNDARLEVWQRELRELRRGQLGVSVSDSWPQKKPFPAAPSDMGGTPATANTSCAGANMSVISGAKQRMNGSVQARLQQDLGMLGSRAGSKEKAEDGMAAHGDEAAPSSSRLPLLGSSKQSGVISRPPDGSYANGPRLRFTETMVRGSSRGPPSPG